MDISVLRNSILFKGFENTEITELLKALNAVEKKYNKGAMIFSSGEITDKLCFVTAGSVTVESNDMWGNRTILNLVGKGQFFAESYALLPDVPMLVDVDKGETSCKSSHYHHKKKSAPVEPELSYCPETGARTYHGISEYRIGSEAFP